MCCVRCGSHESVEWYGLPARICGESFKIKRCKLLSCSLLLARHRPELLISANNFLITSMLLNLSLSISFFPLSFQSACLITCLVSLIFKQLADSLWHLFFLVARKSHLHEMSQIAYLFLLIRIEVIPELSACTQLRQVIIKRLLAHAHLFGSLL